jgi:HEAT repeat protein
LIPTLADPSSTVRATAARAFKTIVGENEDMLIITALYQATHDSNRSVREAAAFTLANAQSDITTIGTRIEELFRQCEHETVNSILLFNAVRDIAEKTGIG